ncbi:MAG: GntR family transcriptional regulator [Pyrinomonadaceae bacterium]|nr:GntR family transcriptional regulator [Pyrinomonadaceae bacterium]
MSQVFFINPADPTPLYAQLTRAIQFAIATGKLRIGEQLPTVRQMAVDLKINANTVAKVYAELERTGIVETRRGVGTFICARHFEPKLKRQHELELSDLADRVVAEAGAMGFTLDDLIDQLQSRRKKELKKYV